MTNFQEQGRAAYKRGDYYEAIRLFDRAIGQATSVQLLDNRAACNVELHQLGTALKDAKAAIHLQREDPTGYLRSGQILCKMGKKEVALEIYTHGLKTVKHIGQGYERLRDAHQELMDILSPPRSRDPLTVLPPEMAEMILEYLSFRTRVRACRVSKQWCSYIRSNPKLWRHLDLTQTPCRVKSSFISRAINCGRHTLKTATLESLYDLEKSLAALVKHCPLQQLEFLGTTSRTLENLQLVQQSKTLSNFKLRGTQERWNKEQTQLLYREIAPRLEHLEVKSLRLHAFPFSNMCTSLRTLCLMDIDVLGPAHIADFFNSIAAHMPALESLTCAITGIVTQWPGGIDLRSCSLLRKISLELRIASQLERMLLPSSVVSLSIGPKALCSIGSRMHDGSIRRVSYLPNLQELSMPMRSDGEYEAFSMLMDKKKHTVGEDGYSLVSQRDSQLLCLDLDVDISSFAKLPHPAYLDLFSSQRLHSLETLRLQGSVGLRDEELEQIIKLLPQLKSLDVSRTLVTGVGVKCAVKCGHIEELIVRQCRDLGRDAVDWARAQGVKIEVGQWSDEARW